MSGSKAGSRQYKILDTDPEQAFDDFTRLAAFVEPHCIS